ncbi:MAG TPA: esterase [Sutterella sp.]|nr:esterase [Sutterella sp.]
MSVREIVYLHGFLSSPLSAKGREMRRVAEQASLAFWAPDLTLGPKAAVERILSGLEDKDPDSYVLVGSSLGGFYAAVVSGMTGARAVLLNPATQPWTIAERYQGEQTLMDGSGRKIVVLRQFGAELEALDKWIRSDASDMLVILTRGDEVLDYRLARDRFHEASTVILPGGDHTISEFPRISGMVLRFALSGALG